MRTGFESMNIVKILIFICGLVFTPQYIILETIFAYSSPTVIGNNEKNQMMNQDIPPLDSFCSKKIVDVIDVLLPSPFSEELRQNVDKMCKAQISDDIIINFINSKMEERFSGRYYHKKLDAYFGSDEIKEFSCIVFNDMFFINIEKMINAGLNKNTIKLYILANGEKKVPCEKQQTKKEQELMELMTKKKQTNTNTDYIMLATGNFTPHSCSGQYHDLGGFNITAIFRMDGKEIANKKISSSIFSEEFKVMTQINRKDVIGKHIFAVDISLLLSCPGYQGKLISKKIGDKIFLYNGKMELSVDEKTSRIMIPEIQFLGMKK